MRSNNPGLRRSLFITGANSSRKTGLLRFSSLGVLCLILTACLAGGGPERSIESYCNTLEDESEKLKDKYEQRFAESDANPLLGLLVAMASSAEALGDLAVISEKLAERAPEEVKIEHQVVADSMRQQVEDMARYADNPLGGIMAGLIGMATDNGSFIVVDEFSMRNCGISLYD